jgi:hypothetical protein
LFSFFSTRAAHEAQVIPPIESFVLRRAGSRVASVRSPVTVLIGSLLPSSAVGGFALTGGRPGRYALRRCQAPARR